ncbi:interleukin-17C-like [Terrapene carolina triunguis]|uniref:interleukin-17C-like n=1 Tax=Terrapene triunguis TaxID=2587831 RepID=UPI000E776C33|nr:interleukin-17C-like [Terrapene carolina triunguis]
MHLSPPVSVCQGVLCALLLLSLPAGQAQKRAKDHQRHHHHHHHHHCFSQEQLQAGELPTHFVSRTMKWDRYAPVQLVPHLEKMQQEGGQRRKRQVDGCPALQLQATVNSEPNERSLSPWRYRIDEDENRYPQKLAFAECLCTGCIDVKTGRETSSLNSVLMHQTMMVLRRKLCPHNASPGTFAFEVEYIKVPVGCTCVLPRSSG